MIPTKIALVQNAPTGHHRGVVSWVAPGDRLLETPDHLSTPRGPEDGSPGSEVSARRCGRCALRTHCATRAKGVIAAAQEQRFDF